LQVLLWCHALLDGTRLKLGSLLHAPGPVNDPTPLIHRKLAQRPGPGRRGRRSAAPPRGLPPPIPLVSNCGQRVAPGPAPAFLLPRRGPRHSCREGRGATALASMVGAPSRGEEPGGCSSLLPL